MHSKKNMFKFIRAFTLIAFAVLTLASCGGKTKFDRKGWDDGDGLSWPNRNAMLDDMLATYKPVGKTYKQVTYMLRYPQRNSRTDRSFEYEITRKMDGLDTVRAKSLVFYLNADSVVTDYKIVEKDNSAALKLKFEKQNKAKK